MASGTNDVGPSSSGRRDIPMQHGIYAPTVTFFDPSTEDIDTAAVAEHAVRLAHAGLQGLVVQGSNGEAVHLSHEERALVTHTTRRALDDAGFAHIPVICGAAEQSVRGTIALCREGAAAGASFALVVPPSYYRGAVTNDLIRAYFVDVADRSPLPLLLYNYPGAVAGIDMDSDLLIALAKHPNIVGAKLTCGNTGKLTRLAAATDCVTATSRGSGFMAFGGMADFALQSAVSGGSGVISGGANVIPRTAVYLWRLWTEGKLDEAMQHQRILSHADWILARQGVPGTKAALQAEFGYGGSARKPLKRLHEGEVQALRHDLEEVMKVENSLPDFGEPRVAT